jgi:hypothetical protein
MIADTRGRVGDSQGGGGRVTLGADKGHDQKELVWELRDCFA